MSCALLLWDVEFRLLGPCDNLRAIIVCGHICFGNPEYVCRGGVGVFELPVLQKPHRSMHACTLFDMYIMIPANCCSRVCYLLRLANDCGAFLVMPVFSFAGCCHAFSFQRCKRTTQAGGCTLGGMIMCERTNHT